MALKESDAIDDSGAGVKKSSRSKNPRCSICLDYVAFNNDRSCVKLVCGHEFHLDCIGSAFNAKGAMMCPNCRNIEKGQWLYAVGSPGYEDPQDEDFYDLSYYEMSFGVRWCPFSSPPLEEADIPSSPYHDIVGHHPIFTEPPSFSSTSHPCPYFTYYGPVPLSSNSSGSHSDSSFNHQWSGLSGPSDMPGSYASPVMEPSYNIRDPHFPPLSATGSQYGSLDPPSPVPQRPARTSNNISRAGSFLGQSYHGHGSSARTGRPATSSLIPPYPGTAARARDRVQALQAYSQAPNGLPQARTPMISSTRRTSSHRAMVAPPASTSDPANNLFVFPSSTSNRNSLEMDSPVPSFHTWERDYQLTSVPPPLSQADIESIWGPFPSIPANNGSGNFRQRHGSERASHGRT